MSRLSQVGAWARVLPSILVAVAMLFAPLTGAMPMPCHDHDEAAQASHLNDGPSVSAWDEADHPDAPSDSAGHGKCCSLSCRTYVLVEDGVELEGRHLTLSRPRFSLADQIGDGVAVAPGLDPPRFQA